MDSRWRISNKSFAFGGWLVLVLAGGTVLAAPEPAKAPERGEVAATPKQTASATTKADVLPSDESEWSTSSESLRVVLREGTVITVGPNSRVLRQPMVSVSLGQKDAASRVYSLELIAGAVEVEVSPTPLPYSAVLIHAARKVGAIVKTGRASIRSSTEGTAVAARAGQDMMVSVAERWRTLRVGRSFTVTTANPAGKLEQLLAPPVARVENPIVLQLDSTGARPILRWNDVPGSRGYLARIYRTEQGRHELLREDHTDKTELAISGLTPGRYSATVTTLDTAGLESEPGTPVTIRIVAAGLPAGAYATGSTIHLPVGERITLLHADGVEMTYGSGSSLFVPVPETVSLHDGHSTRIRMRESNSQSETQLWLEPLDVTPRIVMTPIRAVWPGEPVNVQVSLKRNDGTIPRDANSISASITINARPVTTKWQRNGDILSTLVEKPPFPGPWVVRVMVKDQNGHLIGHDFLEVAVLPQEGPVRITTL